MAEQKQYPSCAAFGDHLLVTISNTSQVDETNEVIYFMESDGAHKYYED
jgi:hypothetical protein